MPTLQHLPKNVPKALVATATSVLVAALIWYSRAEEGLNTLRMIQMTLVYSSTSIALLFSAVFQLLCLVFIMGKKWSALYSYVVQTPREDVAGLNIF